MFVDHQNRVKLGCQGHRRYSLVATFFKVKFTFQIRTSRLMENENSSTLSVTCNLAVSILFFSKPKAGLFINYTAASVVLQYFNFIIFSL